MTELAVPAGVCAQVCAECGRLAWPQQESLANPLRFDAEGEGRASCAHCGEVSWIALNEPSAARALRVTEQEVAKREENERVGNYVLGGIFASFIPAIALRTLLPDTMYALLLQMLVHIVAMGVAWWIARAVRKIPVTTSHGLPQRWSMALPPALEQTTTLEGSIVLTERCLRSPITGQDCAAYEVGLCEDEDRAVRLSDWVFVEQRIAASQVEGVTVDPASTHLQLRRTRVATLSKAELDDAALAYLRQRGYVEERFPLVVFETTIEPNARVTLQRSDEGAVLSLAETALAVG